VPTLSEQRAISLALSDVDALIATLDRLIAKKRDIKQATMQQLVGLYQNLMDTQAQNMAGIRAALAQLAADRTSVV
jgi:restriction endonuclease S subunit